MKRVVLTVLGLGVAAPASAEILSYSALSAVIEYQGRLLAGTVRWFFVSGVPAFTLVLGAVTLVHFLLLFVPRGEVEPQRAALILRKALYFTLIYVFLFTPAPVVRSFYSYTAGNELQNQPDIALQLTQVRFANEAERPISLINAVAWRYVDVFSAALVEEVGRTIHHGKASRRLPLIVHRALAGAQTASFLTEKHRLAAIQYRDACRTAYTNHPLVEGSGVAFVQSMQPDADGIDNSLVLESLTTVEPKPGVTGATLTCLELRNDLNASLRLAFASRGINRANPEVVGVESLELTPEETAYVKLILVNQEVGSILNFENFTNQATYQRPLAGTAPGDMSTSGFGKLVGQIAEALRRNVTENPDLGTVDVVSSLRRFQHRAPVLYGYAAVFFTLMAEAALVLSIVAGRVLFLFRCWLGMLTLKLLPIIWIYTDAFLTGSTTLALVGKAGDHLADWPVNKDLYHEFYTHLVSILEITSMVNNYSFLLLIPFLPGVMDIARRVSS